MHAGYFFWKVVREVLCILELASVQHESQGAALHCQRLIDLEGHPTVGCAALVHQETSPAATLEVSSSCLDLMQV